MVTTAISTAHAVDMTNTIMVRRPVQHMVSLVPQLDVAC